MTNPHPIAPPVKTSGDGGSYKLYNTTQYYTWNISNFSVGKKSLYLKKCVAVESHKELSEKYS